MKILVTGAAGFIGSQLTNRLKNKGHDVIYDLDDRDIDIILLTEPWNSKSHRGM